MRKCSSSLSPRASCKARRDRVGTAAKAMAHNSLTSGATSGVPSPVKLSNTLANFSPKAAVRCARPPAFVLNYREIPGSCLFRQLALGVDEHADMHVLVIASVKLERRFSALSYRDGLFPVRVFS